MAPPLDRTWYNTLIDDDGTGTVGTVWNKLQIDGLLDSIDVSLAGLVDTPTLTAKGYLDKTGTPTANQLALFSDADTVKGDPALTFSSGVLSIGAGIRFPSTQVPSADANTLDDYREMPWTPVLLGTSGQSGQVYTFQVGNAIKIGRMMQAMFLITIATVGTFTGTIRLGGLPVAVSNANPAGALVCSYVGTFAVNLTNLTGVAAPGTTAVDLFCTKGATATQYGAVVGADIAAGMQIQGIVSYLSQT